MTKKYEKMARLLCYRNRKYEEEVLRKSVGARGG